MQIKIAFEVFFYVGSNQLQSPNRSNNLVLELNLCVNNLVLVQKMNKNNHVLVQNACIFHLFVVSLHRLLRW